MLCLFHALLFCMIAQQQLESVWFLFLWCPLLSVDCFHKLCLSGTPSEDCQAGWDLGNRMVRGYRLYAMSLSHEKLCLRYSSVLFEKWGGAAFLKQNRTLEYLRHNFPWDRLANVKQIHRQERTSSEEKSDGFHKKWLIELWTVLMFELLLCCHTAARCMGRT